MLHKKLSDCLLAQRIHARTCKRVFTDLEAVRRPCMPACIFSHPNFWLPRNGAQEQGLRRREAISLQDAVICVLSVEIQGARANKSGQITLAAR
jgi:hypothetical protein